MCFYVTITICNFAIYIFPVSTGDYRFTNNVLSTAQQIWLQKFGGARNPVKEFSDKMSRELQQNIQKPDNEVDSKKFNSSQDVKSSSVGLPPGGSLTSQNDVKSSSTGMQPGERFKQIKEQEARRQREREEARRRSEEAVKSHHTNNKEFNLDVLHKQEAQGEHVQKYLSSTENGLACNSNALVDEQSTSNDLQED
ncbi:hypothetical protein Taro_031008 [Colocasia esculenta]|uniref:Uncharacterized protein n=1 Tax=Colocasia esculenta TaxID=4460 RepID=A0A843VNW4_COLES|nr:hypothetical protein [Colocasia esculenta]